MAVIGTAGHVDHGKSALVQALTGIDPDRLQEEKARGMTIDLGFAQLRLPGGTEAGIVDVPGHERFIKNMLAGVGGIDLALLVIAADEGVMPQTREHLAILNLLGVTRGIVVLTKCDLVDADWIDLVSGEVEEVVKGTTLQDSPLVRCSAVTGAGIEELADSIEARLAETPAKRDLGRPRLPIDRVFTVRGAGTVVTGTLIDGLFSTGQEVEVVPAVEGGHVTTLRARIRGLQSHSSKVDQALPGTRTAANLTGLETNQLTRGQVIATPGWLKPSIAVDVRVRALPSLRRPLKDNLNLTFHSLASEAPARLRLLQLPELQPGEETWAQIRLFKPLAVLKGDLFIIRDANDTLGGGRIVETQARRHPRRRPSVIAALERLEAGDPVEAIYAAIAEAEPADLSKVLPRLAISAAEAAHAVGQLLGDGRIVILGDGASRFALTNAGFERLRLQAEAAVEAHLKANPLAAGMPKEELRNRLRLDTRLYASGLRLLGERNSLVDRGTSVAPPDWVPQVTSQQQAAADAYLATLRASPYTPPTEHRLPDSVLRHLISTGAVVDAAGTIFAADAFEQMTRAVVDHLKRHETITMGQARDLLGSSRRYMQPFLEELDRRHVTMRRGDERLLRDDPFKDAGPTPTDSTKL
jgi:selenocysteine-specific elongation factor